MLLSPRATVGVRLTDAKLRPMIVNVAPIPTVAAALLGVVSETAGASYVKYDFLVPMIAPTVSKALILVP